MSDSFIGFTKAQPRLLSHPALTPLLPGLAASRPPDIQTVISACRGISSARMAADVAVSGSFRKVEARMAALADLQPICAFATAWDAAAYKAQARSVPQFRTDMMLLRCGAAS